MKADQLLNHTTGTGGTRPVGARVVMPVGQSDAITELVRLRADMVRIAHEVEALADERRISDVRKMAPVVAGWMRDAAMRRGVVEACKR